MKKTKILRKASVKNKIKPLIGFIGQGFIGKNYADDFEKRKYKVVRYALENGYEKNRDKIKDCDIVFMAVPTPTTPMGFDDSILRKVIKLVGDGKIAVIKSTVLPGTTKSIQTENPDIFVLHSPEFLTESTAFFDASHPKRNIIGIPQNDKIFVSKAKLVMSVLPKAPYSLICDSSEAEIIKYSRNCIGYVRVIFANLFYDLAKSVGADWEKIREAISADPDNGPTYLNPVHKSGRGAGGHCFIKDFAAFAKFYAEKVGDTEGLDVLKSVETKNLKLLRSTKKDLDLLGGVYGNN